MITGLDDLIVSLGSDAAMIGGMATLYGMLRRGLRGMVREEIAAAVRDAIAAELGDDGRTPREVLEDLREGQAAGAQATRDTRQDLDGLSRRVAELRTALFSHIDRQHRL